MNKSSKYVMFIVIAISASMFVGGIYATPLISNVSPSGYSESVGFGANVKLELYNSEGELARTWEGHNALTPQARDTITECFTGVGMGAMNQCDGLTTKMSVYDGYFPEQTTWADSRQNNVIITPLPVGCETTNDFCDSWSIQNTFDYNHPSLLPATCPAVLADCPVYDAVGVSGGAGNGFTPFNVVALPDIVVMPGDRLVITETFTIP